MLSTNMTIQEVYRCFIKPFFSKTAHIENYARCNLFYNVNVPRLKAIFQLHWGVFRLISCLEAEILPFKLMYPYFNFELIPDYPFHIKSGRSCSSPMF